jgi:thiol-disulfide isomerase/thioredoxin
MKFLCLLILSFAMTASWAQTATSADPAQSELDALIALTNSRPPEGTKGADHYRWFDQLTRKIGTTAFAFIEKYPDDPRRWRAALILQQRRFHPRFVKDIAANYDEVGEAAVTMDKEAIAAWDKKVETLEVQLRAAKDVPADVREQIDFIDMWQGTVMPAFNALHQNKVMPDWGVIDAAFQGYFKRYPGAQAPGMLNVYVSMNRMAGETDEMAVLQKFVDSPNRQAREFVKARERFIALSHTPFEMKFTALDGREVDVAKLRGKVVLIDFWATWCNPCIAELPNVKTVYEQYRDKGFEIIGISVDSEKDRRKFADLVAAEGVTWPQHFDGKGWDNQYALEYTVTGVPAMLLLDQKGFLVSTDARGEKLGAEVKRLLGQ